MKLFKQITFIFVNFYISICIQDIPDDILQNYQQGYDKPGHTSGISSLDGYLPLQDIQYNVDIHTSISHVSLQQTFINDKNTDLDVDYIFAVSPDAAFVSLQAEINGVVLIGKIKDKEVAKSEYQQAIDEGKQAAYSQILEGIHNMMILKLGNLQDGATCIVTYKYVEKLKIVLNKFWQFYIPTNISPRTTKWTDSTSQQLQNEGADLSSTINQNVEWQVNVKIYYQDGSTNDIEFLQSPTHQTEIDIQYQSSYAQIQFLSGQQHFPTIPYELLFRNSITNTPGYMLSYLENDNLYPYAAEITFFPDFNKDSNDQAFQKYKEGNQNYEVDGDKTKGSYIFMIDRSGSMAGNSWSTAKDTLKYAIQNLPNDSYIDIVSFGSEGYSMFKRPVKINEKPVNFNEVDEQNFEEDLNQNKEEGLSGSQTHLIFLCSGFFVIQVFVYSLKYYIYKKDQNQQQKQTQNLPQQQIQQQQIIQGYPVNQQQQQYQTYLDTNQIQQFPQQQQYLQMQQQNVVKQQQPILKQNQQQQKNKFCNNQFQYCQIFFSIFFCIYLCIVLVAILIDSMNHEEVQYCGYCYSSNIYNPDLLDYDITNRENALNLVDSFEANLGGTNIYYPLVGIFDAIDQSSIQFNDYPLNIFLITDGAISNPDEVVSYVKYQSSYFKSQRYYTIGIGKGVDLSLIINVAKAGNGLHQFVLDGTQIQERFDYLYQDSISYFINQFSLDFDESHVELTVPKKENIPILRKNQAFSMFVLLNDKFGDQGNTKFSLKYYNSQEQKNISKSITLDSQKSNVQNSILHSLTIKKVLDNILYDSIYSDSSYNNVYIKNEWNSAYYESVFLSERYQVLSEFTSFVLVEEDNENNGNSNTDYNSLEQFNSEEQNAQYSQPQNSSQDSKILNFSYLLIITHILYCFIL